MIADKVWAALGQPGRYIEPFFGSGAVLLRRPKPTADRKHYEIVCDLDGFVSNAWRAIQFAPDETAKWCDWPVNHADLMARRRCLLANERRLLDNLVADPKWYDSEIAGYWIWGMSVWIGSGLTASAAIPHLTGSCGVTTASGGIPILAHDQSGVINERRAGGKIPYLNHSQSVTAENTSGIYDWFNRLSNRLRDVKVVCGDWRRVCGGNWQVNGSNCGIFFDPPYGVSDRADVYHCDDKTTVAADVKEWARKRGANKAYRIVIAGYEEYQDLVDNDGWTCEGWSAAGGYGNMGDGAGKENRHREMLYYSPHCLTRELPLFEGRE